MVELRVSKVKLISPRTLSGSALSETALGMGTVMWRWGRWYSGEKVSEEEGRAYQSVSKLSKFRVWCRLSGNRTARGEEGKLALLAAR